MSLYLHVDADVAGTALDRLRDVLANGESSLGDERERERFAVLRPHAVGAELPPRFVEQAFALAGFEGVRSRRSARTPRTAAGSVR